MGYQLIEHITVGSGGAASIEFTGIPQDGVDLVMMLSLRSSNTNVGIKFNGISTGFSSKRLSGSGSSASANSRTDNFIQDLANFTGMTANTFASTSYYISNYSGATAKSFSVDAVQEQNTTAAYQVIAAALWNNTAAITSIEIVESFVEYSTASIYKITAD
jgi:hypothetical protein